MGINQSMNVCQCLATVGGNEERDDQRSMDKFKVYTIDCLENSALPQLVRLSNARSFTHFMKKSILF